MDQNKIVSILKNKKIDEEDNIKLEDFKEITNSGDTFLHSCIVFAVKVYDDELLDNIANNYEFLLEVLKNGKKGGYWLALNDIDISYELLMQINNGKYLMDYICCDDYFANDIWIRLWRRKMIDKMKDNIGIVSICCRSNGGFEFLGDGVTSKILESDMLSEWLKNEKFAIWFLQKYSFKEVMKVLKKYKLFEIMKYAPEDMLLEKNRNGKTILERLIKKGIDPEFYSRAYWNKNIFEDQETVEILAKLERIDLFRYGSLDTLLEYPNEDNNYFQMLVNYNKANNYKFDMKMVMVSVSMNDVENISKGLIILMKSGDFKYFNFVSDDKFGYFISKIGKDRKSLLEYLLDEDRELVIKNLKVKNLKVARELLRLGVDNFIVDNFKVALELRNAGITNFIYEESEDKYFKKGFGEMDVSLENLKIYNKHYCDNAISPVEDRLEVLKNLFLQDGKSNSELVEALIASYRYATSANEEMIKELEQLILIKENNMDKFLLEEITGRSFFCGKVSLENPNIRTINHEIGHALHFYLASEGSPDGLDEVISRRVNSPGFYEMVKEVVNDYRENWKVSSGRSNKYFWDWWTEVKDIERYRVEKGNGYLSDMVKKVAELALDSSYSLEEVMKLLDNMPTMEEIIERKKNVELSELSDYIFSYFFDQKCYISVGDIIDGICGGKFLDGTISYKNGERIGTISGHGEKYYSKKGFVFMEMMADYSAIIKSKYAQEGLELLKKVAGDELFNMISTYYHDKIIYSDTYNNSKGVSIK